MFQDNYNDMDELETYLSGCDVKVFQDLDVCVPVTVKPYVRINETEVECIGEPYIITNHGYMKGKNVCKFNLAQKLCVMIPIEFIAKATNGPISVICGELSGEDCSHEMCCENKEYNEEKPVDFYIKGKKIEN